MQLVSVMTNPRKSKMFRFTPTFKTIQEILADQELAKLGDAYTNLVYSLYLSVKIEKPTGAKADSRLLSKALKQSGLRAFLPSRVDRHKQADAAESLLVYAWLQGSMTIKESVEALAEHKDVVKAFTHLLSIAREKLDL